MQQFCYAHNNKIDLIIVVAKIVDDILIKDIHWEVEMFLSPFSDRFKLEYVASGPVHLGF